MTCRSCCTPAPAKASTRGVRSSWAYRESVPSSSPNSTVAMSNLANLIFTGTFERYPDLRIGFAGFGFMWLPPFLWRLDMTWHSSRIDVPWVRLWPREYVRRNVRLTTHPLDDAGDADSRTHLIENYLADSLMFSSGYPQSDLVRPADFLDSLPSKLRGPIASENAASFLRLTRRTP